MKIIAKKGNGTERNIFVQNGTDHIHVQIGTVTNPGTSSARITAWFWDKTDSALLRLVNEKFAKLEQPFWRFQLKAIREAYEEWQKS